MFGLLVLVGALGEAEALRQDLARGAPRHRFDMAMASSSSRGLPMRDRNLVQASRSSRQVVDLGASNREEMGNTITLWTEVTDDAGATSCYQVACPAVIAAKGPDGSNDFADLTALLAGVNSSPNIDVGTCADEGYTDAAATASKTATIPVVGSITVNVFVQPAGSELGQAAAESNSVSFYKIVGDNSDNCVEVSCDAAVHSLNQSCEDIQALVTANSDISEGTCSGQNFCTTADPAAQSIELPVLGTITAATYTSGGCEERAASSTQVTHQRQLLEDDDEDEKELAVLDRMERMDETEDLGEAIPMDMMNHRHRLFSGRRARRKSEEKKKSEHKHERLDVMTRKQAEKVPIVHFLEHENKHDLPAPAPAPKKLGEGARMDMAVFQNEKVKAAVVAAEHSGASKDFENALEEIEKSPFKAGSLQERQFEYLDKKYNGPLNPNNQRAQHHELNPVHHHHKKPQGALRPIGKGSDTAHLNLPPATPTLQSRVPPTMNINLPPPSPFETDEESDLGEGKAPHTNDLQSLPSLPVELPLLPGGTASQLANAQKLADMLPDSPVEMVQLPQEEVSHIQNVVELGEAQEKAALEEISQTQIAAEKKRKAIKSAKEHSTQLESVAAKLKDRLKLALARSSTVTTRAKAAEQKAWGAAQRAKQTKQHKDATDAKVTKLKAQVARDEQRLKKANVMARSFVSKTEKVAKSRVDAADAAAERLIHDAQIKAEKMRVSARKEAREHLSAAANEAREMKEDARSELVSTRRVASRAAAEQSEATELFQEAETEAWGTMAEAQDAQKAADNVKAEERAARKKAMDALEADKAFTSENKALLGA